MGWSTQSSEVTMDSTENSGIGKQTVDYANSAPYTSVMGDTRLYAVWEPNVNNLTFDGEDLSGSAYVQKAATDQTVKLTPNRLKRKGYTFLGWSTLEDGDVEYEDGAEYTMGIEDTTLYSVWKANEYWIIYDANAPGCQGDMEPQKFTYGTWGVLDPCTYEREGYTFDGWDIVKEQKNLVPEWSDGSDYMVDAKDTILYAKWKPNVIEIQLYANIDDNMENDPVKIQYAAVDSMVTLDPMTFENPGYVFDGWSTEPIKYQSEEFDSDEPDMEDETETEQEIVEEVIEEEPFEENEENEDPLAFLNPVNEIKFKNRDELMISITDIVLYAKWREDESYLKNHLAPEELTEADGVDEKPMTTMEPDGNENGVDVLPTGGPQAEPDIPLVTSTPAPTAKSTVTITFVKTNGEKKTVTKDKGNSFKDFSAPSKKEGSEWCREEKTSQGKWYRKLSDSTKINQNITVTPCYAVKFYSTKASDKKQRLR